MQETQVPVSPSLAGEFFTTSAPGEPPRFSIYLSNYLFNCQILINYYSPQLID